MAKAKNTRGASAPSRRAVLAAGGAMLLPPSRPFATPPEPDPVLALWQEWQRLDAEAEAHRRAWQAVESLLFRATSFSDLKALMASDTSAPGSDLSTAEARSAREQLCADLTALPARRRRAVAIRHRDELRRRHIDALERAEAMADRLCCAPAASLTGVAAKLTLVLEWGQPSPDAQEFPWPQLRSALADLQRFTSIPVLLS